MRLRPRLALRHSQGVGVQAPPSRCLSDRATRKAVLQRPEYLALVRSTKATHVLSRLSTHYWFTAETPSTGGTFLERNIADTYVILDARGQAPSVHMRWTECLGPRQLLARTFSRAADLNAPGSALQVSPGSTASAWSALARVLHEPRCIPVLLWKHFLRVRSLGPRSRPVRHTHSSPIFSTPAAGTLGPSSPGLLQQYGVQSYHDGYYVTWRR